MGLLMRFGKYCLFAILFVLTFISSGYAYTVFYDCGACTPPTYDEMNTALTNLCTANPTWSCTTFGQGTQGHNINGIIINPIHYRATILLDGAIHGDEKPAAKIVLDWLNYLSANPTLYTNIRWVVIPVLNPDGYVVNGRKNYNIYAGGYPGRQVDLNRNHAEGWGLPYILDNGTLQVSSTVPSDYTYIGPYANSEPETIVMRGIVTIYRPDKHFTAHQEMKALIANTGTSTTLQTVINAALTTNSFTTMTVFRSDSAGQFRNYSYSQGAEAYEWETGVEAQKYESNRYICGMKTVAETYPAGFTAITIGAGSQTITIGGGSQTLTIR